MFAQKIEFKYYKNKFHANDRKTIERFIQCLTNNGQILSEYSLIQNENNYALYVTTPKVDSLDPRFDSIYVKNARDEVNERYSVAATSIGVNVYSQEYCSCKSRDRMEMQTFANDLDSVFPCCTCGKPIALYELPYLDRQDDHYCIVNWQEEYSATDTLWLNSLSDRFTGNQLVNIESALNKHGREIANEIGTKTGCKCYYNVFDDLTKKVKFIKVNGKIARICPSCEKPMKRIEFFDDYERYVCDACGLSSNLMEK